MRQNNLVLSTLAKTWIFDLDGTIVKHNGYKTGGRDSLLSGAKGYLEKIPPEDKIIFLLHEKKNTRKQRFNSYLTMEYGMTGFCLICL